MRQLVLARNVASETVSSLLMSRRAGNHYVVWRNRHVGIGRYDPAGTGRDGLDPISDRISSLITTDLLQYQIYNLLCIVRIVKKKNRYHFLRSTLSQKMPPQLPELSTLHSLLGPFPCQVSLPLLHHPSIMYRE